MKIEYEYKSVEILRKSKERIEDYMRKGWEVVYWKEKINIMNPGMIFSLQRKVIITHNAKWKIKKLKDW